MRGMPPVRILTAQPSLANNPFVANTGPIPLLLNHWNASRVPVLIRAHSLTALSEAEVFLPLILNKRKSPPETN